MLHLIGLITIHTSALGKSDKLREQLFPLYYDFNPFFFYLLVKLL